MFKATVQTQTSLLRHFAFPLSSQIHHLLLIFFNTRGYSTNLAQSTSIQSNSLLHEKVFISALHIQVTQFSFLVSTRFFTNRPQQLSTGFPSLVLFPFLHFRPERFFSEKPKPQTYLFTLVVGSGVRLLLCRYTTSAMGSTAGGVTLLANPLYPGRNPTARRAPTA